MKPKTLIVDDSHAITNAMAQKLDELGIDNVTTAPDGMKALELFKNAILGGEPYSLIFLDLMMPVVDGQTTLKIMRAVEKQSGITGDKAAVIIITTSRNSPNDMIDAIHGDCTDYIVKPADVSTLQKIISKHMIID